jgi:SAM-dependent methyltransferase
MAKKFYDRDLAELHNRHYSSHVDGAAPGAVAVLRAAGILHGVVLDLGCGGGQLSQRLLREGFEPIGLDVSASMIRLARKRVPEARFIRGSVDRVALPPCNAAIAVGEVFNYPPSKTAVRRAFRNVFRSLKPGGVLVFDTKQPLPGPDRKANVHARRGNDWAILVEAEEDPRQRKLVRRIVSFSKEGRLYRRDEEVHRQIIPNISETVQMLNAAGFTVKVFRGYGKFAVPDDRRVFIARKPR